VLELELVINGQLTPVQLEDGLYSVGRAPDTDITIAVPSVSKHHAQIRVEGSSLFVKDLGSTNGTDIDGQPIGNEEIEAGKHATIRFAGVPLWRTVRGDDSTATLSRDDEVSSSTIYRPDEDFSEKARARIVEMLSSLFELVASEADANELERQACAFVARFVDADRVILLEDEGEGTELTVKSQWLAEGKAQTQNRERLRLSTTIVNQVLKDRSSILVSNTLNDPRFADQGSILHLDLKSAIAAPLFDNQRVRGILYVDCSRPDVQYTTEDLQVLTATSNAVAVKLRTLTLEKEIRTAARIQKAMLPDELPIPEGWQLDCHLTMCREVGGDLYHCLTRPDGRTMLVLGDVAGKGIPASLAMSATMVLIRSLNDLGTSLEDMGGHLNAQLCESLAPEQFVTLFVGELDHETGRMRYINAGHEPPRIHRAASNAIDELASTGRPIAMLPFGDFGVDECTLEPGDTLAVFSDGIPEATMSGDEFFGLEGIDEALHTHRKDELAAIRGSILTGIERYLGGENASDDITLMVLRRSA